MTSPWTAAELQTLRHAANADWTAPMIAAALTRHQHDVETVAAVLGLTISTTGPRRDRCSKCGKLPDEPCALTWNNCERLGNGTPE